MVVFLPTSAQLVKAEMIDRVPSPAYDSLSPEARRAWRKNAPESYLNVTRSPEDEEPGSEATQQDLIAAGRQALQHLLDIGAFKAPSDEGPGFYLYRLTLDGHAQTGLVGEVPVSEYDNGTVRIHEEIRDARASLLADHFGHVGAASSPVALAYRQSPELEELIAQQSERTPDLEFSDSFGLTQSIWHVTQADAVAAVGALMADEPTYIIDGHHRAAAASTLAARRDDIGTMFVSMFPDTELQLLGFNRLVRNVDPAVVEQLVALPGAATASAIPELRHGLVGIYASGQWHTLELDEQGAGLGEFDAVRVRDQLLGPVFGIERSDDASLVNLAGDQDIEELTRMADLSGGVAVVLAPIELDAFMSAADNGVILPPKSTYFTPKVRSGVFLRQFPQAD